MHVFLHSLFCQLKPECLIFDALNFYQPLNAMYLKLPHPSNALEHEIRLKNA
jgi:hypothetical protein